MQRPGWNGPAESAGPFSGEDSSPPWDRLVRSIRANRLIAFPQVATVVPNRHHRPIREKVLLGVPDSGGPGVLNQHSRRFLPREASCRHPASGPVNLPGPVVAIPTRREFLIELREHI